MENKLYSRKRITIKSPPKFKKLSWKKKIGLIFIFIGIIILSIIIFFFCFAYPIFKSSCETTAKSLATKIINKETTNIMQNYTYSDLVVINKDSYGNVNLIQTNAGTINEIISKISIAVQEKIDNLPRTNVYINLGSVSGISLLKYIGPKFDIELESAGSIDSSLKTEFISVGINQTLHKIYLDINTRIGILTPIGSYGKNVESRVLLAESVIVGKVPETYYDFNGETEEEFVFETMN